jgi:hypothetical protein
MFQAVLMGACLGLALFCVESWLIARQNLVGFQLDAEGPFSALARTVCPALPSLLARIAAFYVLGGSSLGLVAGLLTTALRPRGRGRRFATFGFEWGVAALLLFLHRAVSRPALVDDLLGERALAFILEDLEPGAMLWAATVWGSVHAVWAIHEHGVGALKILGVGLVALSLGLSLSPEGVPEGRRPPLVVMIGVDAFRPDRLERPGLAPNLASFFSEATRFDNAYTPIAQTEPAWRSLLTAQWPTRTGVRYPLTAESRWSSLPTFVSRLKDAGYLTSFATDCSRFHFEPESAGFSERRQPPRGALNFLLEKMRYRALGAFADHPLGASVLPELIENRAIAGVHDPLGYAERLAEHWTSLSRGKPALLTFHATAAHFPGDPVYPFHRRFVSATEPPHRRTRMHFAPVSPGASGGWTVEGAQGLYDELLAQADAQVGTLLEALRREGRYDDALVIVFSDHGESFHSDHPELAGATPVHGARLSAEENQVLLGIKWPRGQKPANAGSRVGALTRLIDVGPTVLEVQGLPPLEGVEGRSLVPLVRGDETSPRFLYAETGFTHVNPQVFEPLHRAGAPRSLKAYLEAYDVRADGVIEVNARAHAEILADKDQGVFDGQGWWIRSPRADGGADERCEGDCSEALRSYFTQVTQQEPTR